MYPAQVEVNEKNILAITDTFKSAYRDIISEIDTATDFGVANRKAILGQIESILAELGTDVSEFLQEEIPDYYETGADDAVKQLRNTGAPVRISEGFNRVHQQAIYALVDETSRAFGESMTGINRSAQLLLGRAVRESITQKIAKGVISGEALRDIKRTIVGILHEQGLDALIDKSGKTWSLDRYAEMLFRTKAVEARNRGLANRMVENGYDLVQVSSHSTDHQACQVWEGKILSLTGETPGYPTIGTAEETGLFHPNCLTGENLVNGSFPVSMSTRRYQGKIFIIKTASGNILSVTPNHPILSLHGWVAANALKEGDELLGTTVGQRMVSGIDPDYNQIPAKIEDIFRSFCQPTTVSTVSMPISSEDFHGDPSVDGKVNIVFENSLLRNHGKISFKRIFKYYLNQGNVRQLTLFTLRTFYQLCLTSFRASHRIVSSFGKYNPFPFRRMKHAEFHALATIAELDIIFNKSSDDRTVMTADIISQLLYGRPGLIFFDKVIEIRNKNFSGHVYNMETKEGWYVCNSIVTHNCKHAINVMIPSLARQTLAYDAKTARYKTGGGATTLRPASSISTGGTKSPLASVQTTLPLITDTKYSLPSNKYLPTTSVKDVFADPDFIRKYNETKQELPYLKSIISEAAGENQFAVDVKKAETAASKIVRKVKTNPAYSEQNLGDIVRGNIVVETDREAIAMLDTVSKKANVISVENYITSPNEWGYSGININIKMPEGNFAEIQIHTTKSFEIQNALHPFYEKWRDAEEIPVDAIQKSKALADSIAKKYE